MEKIRKRNLSQFTTIQINNINWANMQGLEQLSLFKILAQT